MPLEIPPIAITGHMHANIVVDPDQPPSNVIKATDPFTIQVEVHLFNVGALGGAFNLTVFAESMGPQPEVSLGSVNVNVAAGVPPGPSPSKTYTGNINVVAGTLPPGVYKLVSVLTHSNLGVPTGIAGFEEGPTIQVYTPDPLNP